MFILGQNWPGARLFSTTAFKRKIPSDLSKGDKTWSHSFWCGFFDNSKVNRLKESRPSLKFRWQYIFILVIESQIAWTYSWGRVENHYGSGLFLFQCVSRISFKAIPNNRETASKISGAFLTPGNPHCRRCKNQFKLIERNRVSLNSKRK